MELSEVIRMFHEERQKIVNRDQQCRALLDETDKVLKTMRSLDSMYQYVSPRTSQLYSECKNIIQERNDLMESFELIKTNLSKREELRNIVRRMPDIANQILNVLTSVCQGYHQRQDQANQVASDQGVATSLDEYYGRFFVECRRIKELTGQLESCLPDSNADELLLHLEEIYTFYFDIRQQLIERVFSKNLDQLIVKAHRNYCDLLRQTCQLLVRIIRNEIQLFQQIFPSSSSSQSVGGTLSKQTSEDDLTQDDKLENPAKKTAVRNFVQLLCKIFYEHLRPVVIRVNHLETLAELYKLLEETLRAEVVLEQYQQTLDTLSEDIQERMIFRAEVFFQESVLDYNPSAGDLAYPEKLEIVCGRDLKDFQSMWYPTVQRTVLALFYLNRVLNPLSFKGLAREAVSACLMSLFTAQKLIDERHGGSKIESALFMNKHIAIIRDQLQLYGLEDIALDGHGE